MRIPSATRPAWIVFAAAAVFCVTGCGDDSGGNNYNGCPDRPCDHDGLCDPGENCLWCPDCCTACTLGEGSPHEYIVLELIVPADQDEAGTIGVDLDGDGTIDNTAGAIASLIPFDRPYNEMVAENIEQGRFILLVRLYVDQFPSDGSVTVQLLPGDDDPSRDATEDNLSGTGHVLLHPDVDDRLHTCGSVNDGNLETDPGRVIIPYPYIHPKTGGPVLVPLKAARVITDGSVDAGGVAEVMVGGGISRETMHNIVLHALASFLSEVVREDPDGVIAEFMKDSVDCACVDVFPGCEDVVNTEGECQCWGGYDGGQDPDPAVTATEIQCDSLLHTALRPDVDSDGDCVPDLFSVGFKIRAIPVTIDN